jgi:hypothetical protein
VGWLEKMALSIRLERGLPIVDLEILFFGQTLRMDYVLLDTGSAATIFDADVVSAIGLKPEESDDTAVMYGIGGSEIVYKTD